MGNCIFCQELLLQEQLHKPLTDSGDYRFRYSAAIVVTEKSCRSRSVIYRHASIGFELNYCPECGREYRRRAKK